MGSFFVLFAYFAPDMLLPVASALAGVVGVVMMVGRAPIRFVRRVIRRVARGVRGGRPRAARPGTHPER